MVLQAQEISYAFAVQRNLESYTESRLGEYDEYTEGSQAPQRFPSLASYW
jgi:hypothetical protein